MKKVVIGLIVAILLVGSIVGYKFLSKNKKNNNAAGEVNQTEEYYGKRGNISELDRIKFLSKNDEYLVGMIGLPVSNEAHSFTSDEMIRFALNIAVERYSTMLDTKKSTKNSPNSGYLIDEATVNLIAKEFFGVDSIQFDKAANEHYSISSKSFVFDENIEKTLYYYPVTQTVKEDGSIEITADAIFINDAQEKDVLEKAKFEGKYGSDNVDNTIKFIFNKDGGLTGYQYLQ